MLPRRVVTRFCSVRDDAAIIDGFARFIAAAVHAADAAIATERQGETMPLNVSPATARGLQFARGDAVTRLHTRRMATGRPRRVTDTSTFTFTTNCCRTSQGLRA